MTQPIRLARRRAPRDGPDPVTDNNKQVTYDS